MNPYANLFAGVMFGGGFGLLLNTMQPVESPVTASGIVIGIGAVVLVANAIFSARAEMDRMGDGP